MPASASIPPTSPAYDADAVDHGGMGVGTDQCIRIINVASFGVITLVDATGQIFHIDLMDSTATRRNDTECIESLHAPFHELVTFSVTV